MIAVDTNIFVYAHRLDMKFHFEAKKILKGLAEGDRYWGTPWSCLREFYAIVTNPKIFKSGLATPPRCMAIPSALVPPIRLISPA